MPEEISERRSHALFLVGSSVRIDTMDIMAALLIFRNTSLRLLRQTAMLHAKTRREAKDDGPWTIWTKDMTYCPRCAKKEGIEAGCY